MNMYAIRILNEENKKTYLMNFSEHLGPNNFEVMKFSNKEQAKDYANKMNLSNFSIVSYDE